MLVILLFCLFGQMFTAKSQQNPAQLTQQALNGASDFLSTYQQIKSTDLEKFTNELFRYESTYSSSIAPLLSQFRRSQLELADRSFDAMMPLYEWCGTISTYLEIFTEVNDPSLLEEVIRSGGRTFDSTLTHLDVVLERLSATKNVVSSLLKRLSDDFSEDGEFFQSKLRAAVVHEMNRKQFTVVRGAEAATRPRNPNELTPEQVMALEHEVETQQKPKLREKFADTQRFYTDLDHTIDEEINQVNQTKAQLTQKINNHKNLTRQINFNATFDENFAKNLKRSSNKLNRRCNDYQSKYRPKSD